MSVPILFSSLGNSADCLHLAPAHNPVPRDDNLHTLGSRKFCGPISRILHVNFLHRVLIASFALTVSAQHSTNYIVAYFLSKVRQFCLTSNISSWSRYNSYPIGPLQLFVPSPCPTCKKLQLEEHSTRKTRLLY